jgi:hypothetical protein
MYFFVTVAVLGAAWLLWLASRPERSEIFPRTMALSAALSLGVSAYLPALYLMMHLGYDPPLGANRLTAEGALYYVIRDSRPFWMALFAGAACFTAWSCVRGRASEALWLAAALLAVGWVAFAFSAEPRLAPLIFIGSLVALAQWTDDMWTALSGLRLQLVVPVVAATVVLIRLPSMDLWAERLTDNYTIIDDDLVAAAEYVGDNPVPGIVAVKDERQGWPIGQVFEAITDARVAVGLDLRWAAFQKEYDDGLLVAELFAQPDGKDACAFMRREGIGYAVAHRLEWTTWDNWLRDGTCSDLRLAFENPTYVVLTTAGAG